MEKTKIEEIEIEKIRINENNPNVMTKDMMENLKSEIQRVGFLQPILVIEEGDGYRIIDGQHRTQACKEIGRTKVSAVVAKDMDEANQLITLINMNRIKGSFNPIKFSLSLKTLEDAVSSDKLQSLIYMSKDELDSYKLLRNLPDAVPEDFETKKEDVKKYFFKMSPSRAVWVDRALSLAEGESDELKLVYICKKFVSEIMKESLDGGEKEEVREVEE